MHTREGRRCFVPQLWTMLRAPDPALVNRLDAAPPIYLPDPIRRPTRSTASGSFRSHIPYDQQDQKMNHTTYDQDLTLAASRELTDEELEVVSGGGVVTGIATGAAVGGAGFVIQQAALRGGITGAAVGGVPGFLLGAVGGAIIGFAVYEFASSFDQK
jgi:hypothetical protein